MVTPTPPQYALGVRIGHVVQSAYDDGATYGEVTATLRHALRLVESNYEIHARIETHDASDPYATATELSHLRAVRDQAAHLCTGLALELDTTAAQQELVRLINSPPKEPNDND